MNEALSASQGLVSDDRPIGTTLFADRSCSQLGSIAGRFYVYGSVCEKRTSAKGIVSLTVCLRWSIILLILFCVRHFPKNYFAPMWTCTIQPRVAFPSCTTFLLNCHFLKEISITTAEWDDLKANSGLRSHGCDYMNLEEFGVASASSCSKHLICLSIAIS